MLVSHNHYSAVFMGRRRGEGDENDHATHGYLRQSAGRRRRQAAAWWTAGRPPSRRTPGCRRTGSRTRGRSATCPTRRTPAPPGTAAGPSAGPAIRIPVRTFKHKTIQLITPARPPSAQSCTSPSSWGWASAWCGSDSCGSAGPYPSASQPGPAQTLLPSPH